MAAAFCRVLATAFHRILGLARIRFFVSKFLIFRQRGQVAPVVLGLLFRLLLLLLGLLLLVLQRPDGVLEAYGLDFLPGDRLLSMAALLYDFQLPFLFLAQQGALDFLSMD